MIVMDKIINNTVVNIVNMKICHFKVPIQFLSQPGLSFVSVGFLHTETEA